MGYKNRVLRGKDMVNMDRAFGYACDKYYHVIYDRDRCGYEQRVEGLLLNYASGNVVLLSDKGMYHIKYQDIVFMRPIEPHIDRLSKEFQELLGSFKENDNKPIEAYMHDWAEAYFKGAGDFMEYLMSYARSGKPLYESEMKDILIEFCKKFGKLNEINI